MYHWSQMHEVEEAAHETGINRHTVGDFYNKCRHTATEFVTNATKGEKKWRQGENRVHRRDTHNDEEAK